MNTTFGGFDDTIKLSTIQALDLAIQRVEETTSTITGVFKEKLGGIEQKDAVSNVKVGVQQSFQITKQYYQVMDLMTREILLDLINLAKSVYKKGLTGTLILGDKLNKIFTALPEHYTVTDFDIHITDSATIMKELETMNGLAMAFIKGGIVDPETIIEIVTATGLTKMKEDVYRSITKKKKEADELGKLGQQVQDLDKQLKDVTNEAKKLQTEVDKVNAEKLQLEKDRLQFEKELEWYKAKTLNSFNEEKLKYESKRVALEGAQLLDENHRNDIVRKD